MGILYLERGTRKKLDTGMREGEILGLKWENVDLTDGIVTIEKACRKNRRVLRIPINQVAIETLNAIPKVSEYVFFNPETETHVKDVRTAFKTACKNPKIKNLRIHDLRRTFGTSLDTKGVGLLTIQYLLGHSSPGMTAKYITPISENMRKAVDLLADTFADKEKEKAASQERKKDERTNHEATEAVSMSKYIQ